MIPEGWQRALMAEMDRRFEIYRTNKRHEESLCIDDTQIGVEFAIDFIKQQLAAAPTPPAQGAGKLDADDLKDDFGLMSDRDMLNYLHNAFETEVHNCDNCGFAEPTSAFDSASILRDYLEANTTPPAQEAEPVGVVKHWNVGGSGEFYDVQWTLPVPQDGSRLYTHPQSDELRQAAEEAFQLCKRLGYDRIAENLRAALEKKS